VVITVCAAAAGLLDVEQSARLYVAYVRNDFYHPEFDKLLARAVSRGALRELQLAIPPFLLFLLFRKQRFVARALGTKRSTFAKTATAYPF